MKKYNEQDIDRVIKQFEQAMLSMARNLTTQHEQIMDLFYLGELYDDPDSVLQAIDILASMHGYYGMLYYYAVEGLEEIQERYKEYLGQDK